MACYGCGYVLVLIKLFKLYCYGCGYVLIVLIVLEGIELNWMVLNSIGWYAVVWHEMVWTDI